MNKSKPIPNFLLYIAAYIRDERYIPLLIKLIENEEYTHESCVNACPVVFALAIYSCFTNYPLPKLNDKMAPVPDLLATIERIKKIEIKSDKASYYVRGPGFNSILTRYEKLSTEEIIKKAGPENEGLYYRYLAASVLEYRIADAKYLSELYWLAITETENYVSVDYRSAVYGAIYKAEKAKYEGPGSN